MAYIPKIRDKWNDKEPVTREQPANAGKFGSAPYVDKPQMESVSQKLRATSFTNPSQRNAMDKITGRARNEELKQNATAYANAKRNQEYNQKWYKGDTPTTAEYYSAIRKAQEIDRAKANEIALGFINWQNDPNSAYYEPYLHRMTNTAAAEGIYNLLGVDISGGVTQKDIDYLKQYADYSNLGVGGTPLESKNPAQQLAYWLYNLEKDEKTTQQAEKEMEWLNQDIQTLVDKGFSDEYIIEHMDMTRYPTISKMQANAAIGAVTPLNRPIGYSNDYVFGAIWAARNGGSTGRTAEDIANWHDKVGNSYVPDKAKEAARDPASDNYHPYSFGATIELDPRMEISRTQREKAENNTEKAKKELEALEAFVTKELNTKTPDEIYDALIKDNMHELEENYPTLAKMEFARRDGSYILLTDTVDFALPYFKEWINEEYEKHEGEKQALIDEKQALIDKALGNSVAFMKEHFGVDFSENGGGSTNAETPEAEEEKQNTLKSPVQPDEEADAPKEAETPVQEETASETPVQDETASEETEEETEEDSITPNPYFDIREVVMNPQLKTELWTALEDYRRGLPVADENALAFIEKYPYLFGGVGNYLMTKGGEPKLVEIDTRRYSFDNQVQKENELGKTAAELLKNADTAQSNGYYSQYEYVNLLMTLATEIENAKANGVTFEEYINTEGTDANALLKDTTQRLTAYKAARDAVRKQEIMDYASEVRSLRDAYESGVFDDSYVLVKGETERELAEADPANEGKYIWTEDEKDKWKQLIEESYTTVVTSNEIGTYDPKKYYTLADGDVYRIVEEELSYIDEYVNIDDYEMYGVKNDVYHLIANRVKNVLLNDLGIAKAAGITVDEYYNSIGYALGKDLYNKNYSSLTDYVTELVNNEIEAWRNLEIGLSNELTSAIEEMEWHEYYEDDVDTLNFTEEEIQAVLENGGITEEQANLIRMYNDVKDPEGKRRSLEYWEDNGGIDTIKMLMYQNLVQLSSDQVRAKQGEVESANENYIGVVGNRTEGRASLGYVVGTGVKLGATQHKKNWIETWYAFERTDSDTLEKNYRGEYSREEVRKNIENTINSISDPELRDALILELDLYDGDIYDFNYDFTVEHIREKVRKAEDKIAYIQEEVAQYCTPEQAKMLNAVAGTTNTALFVAENIAVTALATAMGVPTAGAQMMASASTTGITSAGETINTLVDADVSKEPALFVGLVNGAVKTAVELSLDRFVGIDGKFSPANKGNKFGAYMASGIEEEASEGFLKALYKRTLRMPGAIGEYAVDKIKGGAQEALEEVTQEVASTLITNTALEALGKGEYKDNMTWDEAFDLIGESAIQGLILDVGSDIITAPAKGARNAWNKRRTQLESVRKLVVREKVNAAELKKAAEELKKATADGTLEAKLNEARNISDIEEKTAEKIIEKAEELKNSPAQAKLQAAQSKLETAQRELTEAIENEETAKRALQAAELPFETPGTIPTPDEISAYDEAKQLLATATPEKQSKQYSLELAQKAFEEANAEVENEITAAVTQAADEARQEKAQEIKEEQAKQAQEAYQQAEERVRKAEEQTLKEIQESTGASDSDMERVKEKAQKLIEQTAQAQQNTKDELKKNLESRLPGWKVRYDDTSGTEAGWVVRETNRREIVFNASMDADTLASAVAAHELAHVVEDSKKHYEGFRDAVIRFKYGEKPDANSIREAIESIKQEYARDGIVLDDAQAEREHIAELIEDMFGGNLSWVNRLVREKPNLATRIYDWVKEKVDYLKTRFKDGKEAAETLRNFKRVESAFVKALDDAAAGTLTMDAEADLNMNTEADNAEGTVRERALKRRVEAREKARVAARLMQSKDVYKAAGDWKNYNRAIELLYNMGDTSVRPTKPHVIMKTLSEAFGIGVYEGKAPVGTTFEKYDKRASALKVDRNSELDVAFSMYAVGEKIKKMTGIGDPSSDYSMGDFLFEYMMNSDKQLSDAARRYMNETVRPALEKAGRGFVNALESARDNLITYRNSNTAEKLSAYIVSKSDKKSDGIASKIREMKINLIDSTYAAEIVDMVTGSHDFRKAAAYLPYAERRADAVLRGDAFIDIDGNNTGGYTLKTALRDIKKSEVDAFNSYLVAREAVDRFNAGHPPFEKAFTLEDMRETVAMYEKKYSHFKAAGERYDSWWDNFMQTYVVSEGFLSPEDYARMKEVHPHYVSFARGGTKKYKITYVKGNSDLEIIAPIESAIAMVNQFTKRAAHNRFAQTFDRLYQQNEDLGFIATELKTYAPEAEIPTSDPNVTVSKTDNTFEITKTDDALKALAETIVYADDAKYGDVFTVYRNDGTMTKYALNDKALFDLLSGYSYEVQNKALKTIGAVTRFMTRATTGINPLFLVTNSVRDFQKSVNYGSWAYTYADGLYKWFKTFVPTLFEKGKDLEQYKNLGGGGWSVIRLTSNKGKNSYKNALFRDDRKFRELSLPQMIGRVFQSPRRLVERVGDAVETTSRLVEYKYGKHDKTTQQGRIEAFMAAQEVTVDFERGGKQAQLLRTFIPFANATMQGYVQNIRMYTDAEKERIAPRIAKSLFNSALLGAVSAIMNKKYLGEDDEKYTELTEEQKQGYILFPLFGGGEREFLRLPVAQDWLTKAFFEFGRQLGSGEYKDETLGGDILSLAIDMVAEPILGSTTIISPILDVGKNLSWSNTPIVKQSIQKYAPEARYDATTAEVFKWASRQLVGTFRDVIGISGDSPFLNHFTPEALEYLAQQYTGVYGQLLIPALSYNKYTGETDFFGNAVEAIRNRFTLDADSYNQVTNAYYDNSDFVTEVINHARGMREYKVNDDLSDSELSGMYREIKNANSDGGILKKYEDQIQAHRDKIAEYEADNSLTDAAKADLVEAETERINQIMRDYNAWVGERKDMLKGTLFNREYRLLAANADVSILSDTYRTAYENNEPYMLEAVRLKNNGTGKSVLPQVDYTFTYDKTNWEVKDEYREDFEKAFENAYAEEIRREFDGNSDYESWEEDDKATFFSRLRGNAQATAKQKAIDEGWIEEKN